MKEKQFGDAGFEEGLSLTLWSGNFTRANPTATGVFSPFSFKEIEPSGSSQCKGSLILSMVLGAKGDFSKSLEEMKAFSKVETMVPIDYYGFIFQMKAFSTIVGIILGEERMRSVQLLHLVRQIKKIFKQLQTSNSARQLFPSKFEWIVNSRFHLFLQDCRKSLDREDVNNQIIDFNDLHKDILLQKFNVATLPASYSVVEPTTKSNNKPDQKKKSNNTLNNAENKIKESAKMEEKEETKKGRRNTCRLRISTKSWSSK
jgi:hypothetical protein